MAETYLVVVGVNAHDLSDKFIVNTKSRREKESGGDRDRMRRE